jgi:hypothetical protein
LHRDIRPERSLTHLMPRSNNSELFFVNVMSNMGSALTPAGRDV